MTTIDETQKHDPSLEEPRHAVRQPRNQISERVRNISASGIRRYFDLLATMDDGISLGVGEPDFETPAQVSQAGIRSIQDGQTQYTSNYGILELREALSDHLRKLYNVQYSPTKEMIMTVGSSEALDLAFRATLNPGDEVLIPNPGYVAYKPDIELAGAKAIPVPTSIEDRFALTAAAVEQCITPQSRAILLGFPNNPTGAVLPRAEAVKIVELAEKHDLLLISDEIYDRLSYGIDHVCIPALPGAKERTVLVNGFSKAYAMTGWRIGYACAPAPIIEAMMKVHQYTMMCAPTMSQYAALEALRSGEPDVQRMVAEYDRRRRFIVDAFNRIGLPCYEPQGAFYAFPQVSHLNMSDTEFVEKLLMEEHVIVVPGSAFGERGAGYVRCCYASSLEKIEEAISRIDRFVQKRRA